MHTFYFIKKGHGIPFLQWTQGLSKSILTNWLIFLINKDRFSHGDHLALYMHGCLLFKFYVFEELMVLATISMASYAH
jgi:hypothetical protein